MCAHYWARRLRSAGRGTRAARRRRALPHGSGSAEISAFTSPAESAFRTSPAALPPRKRLRMSRASSRSSSPASGGGTLLVTAAVHAPPTARVHTRSSGSRPMSMTSCEASSTP